MFSYVYYRDFLGTLIQVENVKFFLFSFFLLRKLEKLNFFSTHHNKSPNHNFSARVMILFTRSDIRNLYNLNDVTKGMILKGN